MEVKTFDNIVTDLCDTLDSYIAPRFIKRSNTNIIFLILKAFAKGLEVINNLVVVLSNKFNPMLCSDEDLVSIGKLTGSAKFNGSKTGLAITCRNTTSTVQTFKAGEYSYSFTSDDVFMYTFDADISVQPNGTFQRIFLSTEPRRIEITQQNSIQLERTDKQSIPSAFVFSCVANPTLLGSLPETNTEYRMRINSGDTASTLMRMQNELRALPSIFDAQVYFNKSSSTVQKGGVSVPPWNLLVILNGEVKSEVAETVAKYGIFPTVQTDKYVDFANSVFSDGYYRVYYKDFATYGYHLEITYKSDETIITNETIEEAFKKALAPYTNTNIYTEIIESRVFGNVLTDLGLRSVRILNIDIVDDVQHTTVDYIEVPVSFLAQLNLAETVFIKE